jgi:hypothetical protein
LPVVEGLKGVGMQSDRGDGVNDIQAAGAKPAGPSQRELSVPREHFFR